MDRLCCVGISLAARIIGTYTMSLSILTINVLMSNYFSRTSDIGFFDSIEHWGFLGLNWIQILRNSQVENKAQTAVVLFLMYTVLFLLASAYLALGSISRKPKCAVPWMYLQMISIIDQSVALFIHLTHAPRYGVYDKTMWYIPVSSVYLLMCTYFWVVVQSARRQWVEEQQSCNDFDLREVVAATQASNEPKTPSFISQSFAMFESPRPPTIPPK